MKERDRVRKAIMHIAPDRVPANFQCVPNVMEKLKKHFGFSENEQVYKKFEIDIREVIPKYIGPELKRWTENGVEFFIDYWNSTVKRHLIGNEFTNTRVIFPFDEMDTIEQINNFNWPSPDWFDYESIKYQCDQHKDKAIIMGHPGPFQVATYLRSMEKMFVDMAIEPEFAHRIYDRLVEFELEYYERILIAADGQIDILRPHDDYGTQLSMLFSTDMWREFFKDNTKKLVNLAHKYGSFYQQHSCGAIRSIIPELIDCGVDVLEPIQKVPGLEPADLKRDFGDKLAFHGGIDTQGILPFGTPQDVINETRYFIDTLNVNGGYILMSSQALQNDIPIENIEALFNTRD